MSVELANASKILDQFASNQGYTDLIDAVEKLEKTPANMPLIVFIERGFSDAVAGCITALKALAKSGDADANVKKTIRGLIKLMDGEDFVIITDGTSSPAE